MAPKPKSKTIVLIKKVEGHAGSHGGAWKVAYADFVTALMALFIVLWLMDTTPQVRAAVAGYFQDPRSSSKLTGSGRSGSTDSLPITKTNFKQVKARLEQKISEVDNLKSLSNQVTMVITPEGLRIDLLETKDGSFFKIGSAVLNANGREILTLLAGELGKIPNSIMIEGHTDARPYIGGGSYNNWNLSADRALSARTLMMAKGLRPNQVSQISGFADEMPRDKANPDDPSNRRITLVVQYRDAPPIPGKALRPETGQEAAAPSAKSSRTSGAATAIAPKPSVAKLAVATKRAVAVKRAPAVSKHSMHRPGLFSRLLADVRHP